VLRPLDGRRDNIVSQPRPGATPPLRATVKVSPTNYVLPLRTPQPGAIPCHFENRLVIGSAAAVANLVLRSLRSQRPRDLDGARNAWTTAIVASSAAAGVSA
jgi:hypothetical protein